MNMEMSSKTRERLLYLISPIAFLVIWQILLMAGIGDRRFVPARAISRGVSSRSRGPASSNGTWA